MVAKSRLCIIFTSFSAETRRHSPNAAIFSYHETSYPNPLNNISSSALVIAEDFMEVDDPYDLIPFYYIPSKIIPRYSVSLYVSFDQYP